MYDRNSNIKWSCQNKNKQHLLCLLTGTSKFGMLFFNNFLKIPCLAGWLGELYLEALHLFIIHYFLAHLYISARRAAALTLASAVPVAFGISKMLQLKWRLAIGMKVFSSPEPKAPGELIV